MRFLVWLFRAFLFFTLFAFALNNLHSATINWFFGVRWNAPLVIVVLVAFGAGCALGVLAMVPSWWKHRRQSRRPPTQPAAPGAGPAVPPAPQTPPDVSPEQARPDGL